LISTVVMLVMAGFLVSSEQRAWSKIAPSWTPEGRSTFSGGTFAWMEARMDDVTARFKDELFNSPNEIRIMDQLAEWNRQHLDARFASAQLYNPKSKRLRVVAQREFA